MSMRKLLVTGGAGFIGSHFIREMIRTRSDIAVTNLDKLTYSGNPANLHDLKRHPRYRFVRGDICDRNKVERLMRGAWGVVHFAAETHVDRSIVNASVFLKTNVLGTHVLLEAARKLRPKRFLHISTDEIYGSLERGSAREDAPLRPNNPYSASKAAADCLVRSYYATYKLPVLIARSSNNFGPYQYPEKVIPLFITNLQSGRKVPLYGKGQHRRDWLFVVDNVRALALILGKGRAGEVYNVGGGQTVSNLALTKTILRICGKPPSFIHRVKDRPGHDFRYSMNVMKLKRLGFTPSHTFEKALRETVLWYRHRRDWWKPLKNNRFTAK